MDATKVILHLLLSFESLLAILHLTLEFVFRNHLQVMQVDLIWSLKCREFDLAGLY